MELVAKLHKFYSSFNPNLTGGFEKPLSSIKWNAEIKIMNSFK